MTSDETVSRPCRCCAVEFMNTVLKALWRALRATLLALLAIVIFIEEWGWRPLTAWAARCAQWPPLARLEAWLRTLSPFWALALFAVPAVALFPIKLLALWAIQQGQVALGVTVVVAAKLLGTAVVGRLFIVVESQLMQIPWVAHALGWWRATRRHVLAWVHASRGWRWSRWFANRLKKQVKSLFKKGI